MRSKPMNRFLPNFLPSHKTSFSLWCLLIVTCLAVLPACNKYPEFEVVITNYDPAQAYNGITYYQSHVNNSGMYAVDMDGTVLWEYHFDNLLGLGFNVMSDGNVIAMPNDRPMIIDPATSNVVWEANQNFSGHHSIFETPWGTIMFLSLEWVAINTPQWGDCQIKADVIVEIDFNSQTLWEWHMAEYVDPTVHYPPGLCEWASDWSDWSHCNTVRMIQDYSYDGQTYDFVVLLLSRELDTFYMIDYTTGDILWSCGQHGDFGYREPPEEPLFNKAHEIEMLDNGNFQMFDNGTDRDPFISKALEIAVDPVAGTAVEAWSWTDPDQDIIAPWGGDSDRLPNGNTLISDVRGIPPGAYPRMIEINPLGEKVWEATIQTLTPSDFAYSVFQFKRVPHP